MYIPNQMKTAIKKAFYDKTVYVLGRETIIDAEGGVNVRGVAVVDNFKGNVNFSSCKKIQEEYGLDYNIDVAITTDYTGLKLNDMIKYEDMIYNVTDTFIRDSHVLVVATKWQR